MITIKISALTDIFLQGIKQAVDSKLISTREAAERLGVHQTRVQVLIREKRLPATQVAGTYLIREEDLKLVADRKPGRPPKAAAKPAKKAAKRKVKAR
jgi:excisionase family DNA binding protein